MARIQTVAGHTVEQHASPNIGGTMTGHRGVVLHIAQGTYRGTIAWQMNPDQKYKDGTEVTTSSTWVIGRTPGEIAQMVDSERIAWAQRGGSRDWHSIELAGYAPNPPTDWQIEACAHILAWEHHKYGVPIQATNLTSGTGLGHHSMDNDTTTEWGHDACPGGGVIGAKDAIVRRAMALTQEVDVTPEEHQWLKDIRHVAVVRGKTSDGSWFTPGLEAIGVDVLKAVADLQAKVDQLVARPPLSVDVAQLAELLYNAMPAVTLTREEIRAACEEAVRAVAQDAGTP